MLSHPVYRLPYLLLPFTPHWQTFRPAAGNIYGAECVQVEALRALTAVSYQVCLHESRLVFLPGSDDWTIIHVDDGKVNNPH